MKHPRPAHSRSRRRGAAVVLAGISLITLLLCASLAVGVGCICALVAEAQNTGGVEVPPLDFGDVRFNNDNAAIRLTDGGRNPWNGGLNMRIGAGGNLTLAPGTYYLESLTAHSTSGLIFTGLTTIYLNGDMDVAGAGILNTTGECSTARYTG